jgi:hypothetical protein
MLCCSPHFWTPPDRVCAVVPFVPSGPRACIGPLSTRLFQWTGADVRGREESVHASASRSGGRATHVASAQSRTSIQRTSPPTGTPSIAHVPSRCRESPSPPTKPRTATHLVHLRDGSFWANPFPRINRSLGPRPYREARICPEGDRICPQDEWIPFGSGSLHPNWGVLKEVLHNTP